jgi:hypothetical protein
MMTLDGVMSGSVSCRRQVGIRAVNSSALGLYAASHRSALLSLGGLVKKIALRKTAYMLKFQVKFKIPGNVHFFSKNFEPAWGLTSPMNIKGTPNEIGHRQA